jgi:hypothetical protein
VIRSRWVAAALAPFLLWPLSATWDASLRDPARPTGWLLLAFVVGLALFGIRRRVPVLRLGSARAWLRLHLALGWSAVVAFLFHAGATPPDGVLDLALYLLFLVVALSGAVGLAFDRLLPVRLAAAAGEQVLFERIPAMRETLRREVEREVLACVEEGQGRALANFYTARLLPWFAGPRHVIEHWLDLERSRNALLSDIRALGRYASPREREALLRIAANVERKDALDFRHSQHLLLRSWLLVHAPASWALILAGGLHALLAELFRGGP